MKEFYSNGKLLLTGEYAILDGALGLALPTKYGQSLRTKEQKKPIVHWKSYDQDGAIWFEGNFDLPTFCPSGISATPYANETAMTLGKILSEAYKLNPSFINTKKGYFIETHLNFSQVWGLGSSSTLINNIAQWAKVNPYTLLWNGFSGSGYDIACAQHDSPILFRLKDGRPEVETVTFEPNFKSNLYFIHLNKKQNSREGIARYRTNTTDKTEFIAKVSKLSNAFYSCNSLYDFENLIVKHETLISDKLGLATVKEKLFPEYAGAIKSLGAWGGDFVIATGDASSLKYFKEKGYDTIIPFSQMVL